MRRTNWFAGFVAILGLCAACGTDSSSSDTTTPSSSPPATSTTAHAPATSTTASVPATTSTLPVLAQPAIWPAPDVVFTTPEAAAADFVANTFGEGVLLGAFAGGDQRSGEIEVFASVDGAPIGEARSTLLLRMLGPSDGWFVLAATSALNTITAPESESQLAAGPVTVEGMAQGFEATIVVNAFPAGHADPELDHEVTMAGNFGETLPYSVVMDLSKASPGDVVVLMVRGGTGLETDPGDFSAVPVVIG